MLFIAIAFEAKNKKQVKNITKIDANRFIITLSKALIIVCFAFIVWLLIVKSIKRRADKKYKRFYLIILQYIARHRACAAVSD